MRHFQWPWLCALMISLCGFGGCSRQPQTTTAHEQSGSTSASDPPVNRSSSTPAEGPYSGTADSPDVKQTLRAVEVALKSQAFDDAAAQLLRLRLGATRFSQNDGAAYRMALSEIYSQALEASTHGDARGKAAVQLIRAAGPQ